MIDELDKHLRAALPRVDPGEAFTNDVMARIAACGGERLRRPWVRGPAWRWVSGAVAATLAALLLVHEHDARQMREGLAARKALIQALHVAGQSLELANRAVNRGDSTVPGTGV